MEGYDTRANTRRRATVGRMNMDQYEHTLALIIQAWKQEKIPINALADMGCCYKRSMSSYLYQERRMPADVMFNCLIGLGYKIQITRGERYEI